MTLPTNDRTPSTVLRVDARRHADAPLPGMLTMGTSVTPDGREIGINPRYLTRDGKPWLPVMGECHYVRVPDTQWDDALAGIKAAGVDIVSSYVFWCFHEARAGEFDWSGRRNLRRFVDACTRHGLLAFVRIGPWVHAEARYGGLPGWIVDQMPSRCDDPVYLDYVRRFYREIAAQLDGLLWKDGGPVIGVQIENEYNLTGPQQGAQHIATLKRLARDAGLDVPIYTVTGWDNAVFPHDEVTPVFGGYPDLPWSASSEAASPNEVYGFRFTSRVGGDLGAQTHNTGPGDADAVAAQTPFLGAEYGGGVPTMYRRRPVLDPDDVAAMLPVQLGSGVNLYGYYMLYGGRNPPGERNGHESTATGGYNDLPAVHYDFQAPFGANGEPHAVLGKLRPFHLFLQEWGSLLATCAVHAPARLSNAADDLDTPRFSVRADGKRGFLFFNSHVRQHAMAAQRSVRFEIELATRTICVPAQPVDLPSGAYFIWPLGLALEDIALRYATAQPVTRLATAGGATYVFAATDGIAPEFAIEASTVAGLRDATTGDPLATDALDGALILRPDPGKSIVLTSAGGQRVTLIVLTPRDIERMTVLPFDGQRRLLLTDAHAFERDGKLVLRSIGAPSFEFGVYPPLSGRPDASHVIDDVASYDLFQRFRVCAPTVACDVRVEPIRDARPMPAIAIGGPANAALEPPLEAFGNAAAWRIELPQTALDAPGLSNAYLSIRYAGDIGRLFSGTTLIDDHFYTGLPWQIGVRNVAIDPAQPLTLTVLPLRADAPIYLDCRYDPRSDTRDTHEQIARVESVTWVPEYETTLSPG